MVPRTPAPREWDDRANGRFSPLDAPQRAVVDAFCARARPWALNQAGRTYRHLPAELREQAVDEAMHALRTGAPAGVDRRTLRVALADELTAALRRIHVGWCLNQSPLFRDDAATAKPATAPDPEALAAFLEEGLGGLERAVLQLEIGAGRDTRAARAALRLGPRQYARHRDEGLNKLRDAITGQVAGHVCDQHVAAVVLAATGDPAAADALAGGASRCRACSREAQALRRVLHERLALAPWPFVIKPAGVLAAKLGALGTILGGKSGTGAGAGALTAAGAAGSAGPGAGAITAVLAAAALTTGGIAVVRHDTGPASSAAKPAAAAAAYPAASPAVPTATTVPASARAEPRRAERRHQTAKRSQPAPGGQNRQAAPASPTPAPTTTTTTTTRPAGTAPAVPALTPVPTTAPVTTVTDTMHDTVGTVRDTVDRVTQPLAPTLNQTVDQATGAVQDTVDKVAGTVGSTVGSLLSPGK
jgi:hypothetical protein